LFANEQRRNDPEMTANIVSFRHATAADLPNIVSMLADDLLGGQREDSSVELI